MKKLGSIGLAVLCGFATAQVTTSPKGLLFRAAFAKGHIAKYTVSSIGGQPGEIASVTMTITERVLAVTKGVGTIDVGLGRAVIKRNGKPYGAPVKAGPTGQKELVHLDALGKSADQTGVARQTHIEFSSQPIKPGASWTTSAAVPFGSGFQSVKATYKLVGMVGVTGRRAAELTAIFKGPNFSGEGTAWIAVDDGSLIKESISLQVVSQNVKVPVTVHVTQN